MLTSVVQDVDPATKVSVWVDTNPGVARGNLRCDHQGAGRRSRSGAVLAYWGQWRGSRSRGNCFGPVHRAINDDEGPAGSLLVKDVSMSEAAVGGGTVQVRTHRDPSEHGRTRRGQRGLRSEALWGHRLTGRGSSFHRTNSDPLGEVGRLSLLRPLLLRGRGRALSRCGGCLVSARLLWLGGGRWSRSQNEYQADRKNRGECSADATSGAAPQRITNFDFPGRVRVHR